MMCKDPGYEQKEKPSGASTTKEVEIAIRLQTMELEGKNEHGGTRNE